jgi:hypothetical protein
MGKRLDRERRTIDVMVHIYCHAHHSTKGADLCEECTGLLDYAFARLEKCRYQDEKPACAEGKEGDAIRRAKDAPAPPGAGHRPHTGWEEAPSRRVNLI